jgi:hypothetical protein
MTARNASRKKYLTNRLLILVIFFLTVSLPAYSQIALRGTAVKVQKAVNLTSLTITKPTGVVAGDVLILACSNPQYQTMPSLNGWTALPSGWGTPAVLYKVAGASEPTSYTFATGTQVLSASLFAFSGVDVSDGNPIEAVGGVLRSSNYNIVRGSGVTTQIPGAAIVMVASVDQSVTFSGWTVGSLTAPTEITDGQTTGAALGAAWTTQPTAGFTGDGSATFSAWAYSFYYGMVFALKCKYEVPVINSLTPANAVSGSAVILNGANFRGIQSVAFNGTNATYTVNTINQITATVPAGAFNGPITVTNYGGTGTSGVFTIDNPPGITGFSPTNGPVGSSVTITGQGFNINPAQNAVFFGATRAMVTAASATSLTVTVPLGNTYQYISVTNLATGLTACTDKAFTVTQKGQLAFSPKTDHTAGTAPIVIESGDIDGDGKPDVLVLNYTSSSFSVFRNTTTPGSATTSFAAVTNFTTGTNPYSLAIGDLNGDGKPDVAVTNYNQTSISVFINTSTSGIISFATRINFTTGGNPRFITIGDLDNDGKPDIAVAVRASNVVSVFRNLSSNGGAFALAAKQDFVTGTAPSSVAIGDLNGDGRSEMVVTHETTASGSIFPNTSTPGAISFGTRINYTTLTTPNNVKLADIDGDGKLDVVVANYGTTSASVLRNTSTAGNISVATKVDFPVGNQSRTVCVGDIDGDGKPDLVVAQQQDNRLVVLRNTSTSGTVSFAPRFDILGISAPYQGNICDINMDGNPDIITANSGTANFSVFRQIPIPEIFSFQPAQGPVGTTVTITGTDFNPTAAQNVVFFGATKANVTIASPTSLTVTVPQGATYDNISVTELASGRTAYSKMKFSVQNPGDISFKTKVDIPTDATPGEIKVTDLDGDGKPDLVVACYQNISIYRNTSQSGVISFAAKQIIATNVGNYSIAVGDFNGDGKPDLVIPNMFTNVLLPYRNTSVPGTISFAAGTGFSTGLVKIAVGDLDGDGLPDLAGTIRASLRLSVLRNTSTAGGNITFAAKQDFSMPFHPEGLSIGDLDNDGRPEIAVALNTGNAIYISPNRSRPGVIELGAGQSFAGGGMPTSVKMGDTDGDGKTDLVAGGSNGIWVFRNTGNGTINFSAGVNYATQNNALGYEPALHDIDGDGLPDVAAAASSRSAVFRNRTVNHVLNFGQRFEVPTTGQTQAISIADLDGDGKADLISTDAGTNLMSIYQQECPTPAITGASPSNASFGTNITITGSGFGTYGTVTQGGAAMQVVSWTQTSITATTPENACNGNLVVTNGCNNVSAIFTYALNSTPTILSVSPLNASPGSTLTINGTNFGSISGSITYAGISLPVLTWTNTSIQTTMPANVSGGSFLVTNACGLPSPGFVYGITPVITSFSPLNGAIGSSVTILGKGFQPDAGQNAVYFGATRATITAATTTSLTVSVPDGATHKPLTVTNLVSNLSAQSQLTFNVTLDGGIGFAPKVDLATGNYAHYLDMADLTADGKTDIVVSNYDGNFLSVYRNTSSGSMSFAGSIAVGAGMNTRQIVITDMNGDGKPDLVYPQYTFSAGVFSQIAIHLNNTSGADLAFNAPITFSVYPDNNPRVIAVADFDGDGKPDVATPNYVFRNISSNATPAFGTGFQFHTEPGSMYMKAGDIDGDGKVDLVISNYSRGKMYIFRNTSVLGNISFAPGLEYAVGANPEGLDIGDLDGDGKPDIAITAWTDNMLAIFPNNSTPGNISFQNKINIVASGNPTMVRMGDIDGDGKPDLAVAKGNHIAVFRNTSTEGSFHFESEFRYTSGGSPMDLSIGDLDGDGKPDIAAVNGSSNSISLLRQICPTPVISSITPLGASSGETITINGSGFGKSGTISLAGVALETTSWDITSITAIIPANSCTGNIKVTNHCGVSSVDYPYSVMAKPVIVSVSPLLASPGTSIVITGSTFNQSGNVKLGGTALVVTSWTPTSIEATLPLNACNGNIIVTNTCGTASDAFAYTLNLPAATVPTLSASSIANCGPITTSISITDGALNNATEWKWYSGSCGGTFIGTGTSISVTPTQTTTYFVRGEGGCNAPGACASITITVNPFPAKPTITGDSYNYFCEGNTVTFTSSPAAGYLWSNGETTQSITVGTGGYYSVKVTDANGCISPSSNDVFVQVFPRPEKPTIAAGGPTTFCYGGSVLISRTDVNTNVATIWSNGDINTNSVNIWYSTVVTATLRSNQGCLSYPSDPIEVVVYPQVSTPTITANGPTTICPGGSVTLTSSEAAGYLWSNGATTRSIEASVPNTAYRVYTFNEFGCRSNLSEYVYIEQHAISASIVPSGPTTFCAGGSVSLLDYSYPSGNSTWSTGSTASYITVNTPGTYSVTVRNAYGCEATASIDVAWRDAITVVGSNSMALCRGASTELRVEGATDYQWSPAYGLNTTTGSTVIASPLQSTTYTITSSTACPATITVNVSASSTWYRDNDSDGYGDVEVTMQACTKPDGYVAQAGDCNDDDNTIYPGATEICDGKDNNCNGQVDEGLITSNTTTISACDTYTWAVNGQTYNTGGTYTYATGCNTEILVLTINTSSTWYRDNDSDGIGDVEVTMQACAKPDGYVAVAGDCNDDDNTIYPGATEVCDGKDNNCNGQVDEGLITSNTTTITACDTYTWAVNGQTYYTSGTYTHITGCNTEVLVLTINTSTTWYRDNDSDGYGDVEVTMQACTKPDGYVAQAGDCNDDDNSINPGATEGHAMVRTTTCNGQVDEGLITSNTTTITACDTYTWAVNGQTYTTSGTYTKVNACHTEILVLTINTSTTWYHDNDNDGYGDVEVTLQACTKPDGYVAVAGDCNDDDNTIYPGATEICDGKDNNCNGQVDEGLITSNTTTITACDTYTWIVNGQTYNTGGTYTYATGCNTEILVLTINASSTWYRDNDSDGYGDVEVTMQACAKPDGYVAQAGDCNDDDNSINPGATEICDGKDNNCNGQVDEGLITSNTTTITACDTYTWAVNGQTYYTSGTYTQVIACNKEILMLTINASSTWYRDNDSDGYGDVEVTTAGMCEAGWLCSSGR